MDRELAERLFGPEPVVPGPPCRCHLCTGRMPPKSIDARAADSKAHREWFERYKAAKALATENQRHHRVE